MAENIKHLMSVLLALTAIIASYVVGYIIVHTFHIETVIASGLVGYAILRTLVAVLRKSEGDQ